MVKIMKIVKNANAALWSRMIEKWIDCIFLVITAEILAHIADEIASATPSQALFPETFAPKCRGTGEGSS